MALKPVVKIEEDPVIDTPEIIEESVAQVVVTSAKVSDEYKNFKALIEQYKVQNPVKYELKKEELLAKLETLK